MSSGSGNEDPAAWTPGIVALPWDERQDNDDASSVYSLQSLVESYTNGRTNHSNLPVTEQEEEDEAVETVLEEHHQTTADISRSHSSQHVVVVEDDDESFEESSVSSSRRRRLLLGGVLFTLLFVATISVVAAVLAGKKDDSNNNEAATTASNEVEGQPASSRKQAFQQILSDITPSSDFENPDSPQSKALQWLVWVDPAKLAPTVNPVQLKERYILSVFYFATGGAQWYDSFYFLTSRHVCEWKSPDFGMGVRCNENSKTVSAILIGPNNLQGTLPDEIFLLKDLKSLQIIMNPGLTGPIPSSVGNATNLQLLNLNKNNLNGTIPESLLQLPALTTLWMDGNSFEGDVPPIGEDSNLQWWSCNGCGLDGEIPDTLMYPKIQT